MSERNFCRVIRNDYSRGYSRAVKLMRRESDWRWRDTEILDGLDEYVAACDVEDYLPASAPFERLYPALYGEGFALANDWLGADIELTEEGVVR